MRLLLLLAPLLMPLPGLAQPAPAPAAPRGAEARRVELDQLFAALKAAPDEASAALVELRIRALWGQAASPAVLLLMRRGQRELEGHAAEDALEDFDSAIALAPDYPDAWTARARARAELGQNAEAARDLQEALRLDPRHFGALLGLSALQERTGDLTGAMRSLQAVLAINPRLPGGRDRLRDLRRRALGDQT